MINIEGDLQVHFKKKFSGGGGASQKYLFINTTIANYSKNIDSSDKITRKAVTVSVRIHSKGRFSSGLEGALNSKLKNVS